MEYWILAGGWVLFCLLHSVLAAEWCKEFFRSWMGERFKYYRLIYSMLATVTLGAVLWWQFSIRGRMFVVSPFIQWTVAMPGVSLAVVVMGICFRKYFMRLSGVEVLFRRPGAQLLETRGLHGMVRHPLYGGTLLLIWSLLLWFPSVANVIACVVITIYVRVGIYFEERKLVRIFGRAYENYRKVTPMLIPYKIVPRRRSGVQRGN
ncbi:MAG: isoprenylcysteine carboxylmethyltransferase family protein [Bacteroidetes bacterium]|nr:isoprenylcysteine carboxylmethyltransferase family protein [Bacteroidota bacterium]